jgi:5-methylcytosine-specific restriction endonuclease McrA
LSVKTCSCGEVETEDRPFYSRTSLCRSCYNTKKAPQQSTYRKLPHVRDRDLRRSSESRQDPKRRSLFILKDSRSSDRKAGRSNDLTRAFVESCLVLGCAYCGATDLKMTLDRKDNTLGHLQSNVIPCCIRCNYIRRDMPYEAWLLLVPGLKQAQDTGLFGSWSCEVRKRKLGR